MMRHACSQPARMIVTMKCKNVRKNDTDACTKCCEKGITKAKMSDNKIAVRKKKLSESHK